MCRMERFRRAGSKGFTPLSAKHITGFTFLELLITSVVIGVGITALIAAFSEGIFVSGDASAFRTGSALTQTRMEELRGTSFAGVVSQARAAVPGFTGFDRQVVVTSVPGTNPNFKQADVTVYWSLGGGELSTTLTSYFVNN